MNLKVAVRMLQNMVRFPILSDFIPEKSGNIKDFDRKISNNTLNYESESSSVKIGR
jgi:hypothetical protein